MVPVARLSATESCEVQFEAMPGYRLRQASRWPRTFRAAEIDYVGRLVPLTVARELEKRRQRRRRCIPEAVEITALVERGRAQETLVFALRRAMEMARQVGRPERIRVEARHQV